MCVCVCVCVIDTVNTDSSVMERQRKQGNAFTDRQRLFSSDKEHKLWGANARKYFN